VTTADLVLQYEVTPGQFRCIEFHGVPAARKGWICLASAGEAALGYVTQLNQAIKADLLHSGAVEAEEVSCPVNPSEFDPSVLPDRRKVLFLVPSEDAPLHDLAWYANWNSDDFLSHVMVAARLDKYIEMFDNDLRAEDKSTHLLRAVNATYWQDRIDEAVPEIFQRAEVTSPSSRIFISYRRTDTLNLALQLFDELTHKGFDVFLDRYSIPSRVEEHPELGLDAPRDQLYGPQPARLINGTDARRRSEDVPRFRRAQFAHRRRIRRRQGK
jgi:hypothetical protein